MTLHDLLAKRLVFVSGKGGVGKTTVAVLLGLIAAKKKKRVLLVEMNSSGRLAPIFQAGEIGYEETALAPSISGTNLSPKRCLEEFVIKQVRFRALYQTFFNNKYVTNFLSATPGLSEVLMLGKIYELERQLKNRMFREYQYDFIVVDAPATGHGLSMLEVPQVLERAVKVGPLHKKAVNINEILADRERTAFCLVTLAEEMPFSESLEYVRDLRAKTQIHFGPLFVNAVMPRLPRFALPQGLPEGLGLYGEYYRLARERGDLNDAYVKKITEAFADFECIILPFQFGGLLQLADFRGLAQTVVEGAS